MNGVNFKKITFGWEILLFIFLATSGIIFVRYYYLQLRKTETEQILNISKSVEILIPVSKINALEASPDDTIKPEYHEIKNILQEIIEVNHKARYAFLYLMRDNNIYIIVDSEPENSRDSSPPGQEYIEATQVMKLPFIDKQEVVTKAVTDRWGKCVSTLIPVIDPASDKVVAVYAMDYNAELLNRTVLSNVIKLSALFLALMLSAFFLIRMRERNKTLKKEADQRLKISAALQESEEKYSSLFNNMLNGSAYCKMLFNVDKPVDFIFLNVNKAFESLTGLKDIIGKTATELVPGIREEDKELFELFGKVASTGEPMVFELYLNSLQMWITGSAFCPGKQYFLTVFNVITNQKQAEEEIRLNNFCLNSLLELNKMNHLTLPHLYLYTLNKCVEMCRSEIGFLGFLDNKEENLTIYSSSSRSLNNLQPWTKVINYGSGLFDVWDEIIYNRGPVIANDLAVGQLLKKSPSLQLKNLKNYMGLPIIEDDKIIAIIVICNKKEDFNNTDIKQISILAQGLWNVLKQRQYEDELLSIKTKESDFLKTAFLQNMSHEIRTPMNAIIGFSELLVEQYNNKPKLEYFAGIITQRSRDLLQIINDILDIARIESGQLSVNVGEFNLKLFFAELSSIFKEHQKRIGKEHIDFNINRRTTQEEFIILTDENKLKQIFINLIGNAFKFTEVGQIEGGCTVDEHKNLVFYVSDTGIGISSDKHQMIFDRFSQVDQSHTRLYGGTGLGLSIAKGLVNLLGGEIWLESEPGKGTTFYFNIAYKKTQTMPQEPFFVVEPEEFFFPDKTVLIVEDDPDNAEFLKEILADKGLTIVHTGFAKEAVKIATDRKIDMILMDINLPDMDGYEATRLIKKQKPNIKIIAQTAYAAQRDRNSAIEAGCDDYMSKPLKYELLLTMMKKHFLEV
jgi:signal transduction histidine kinase/CheY-like chemotaxis protein/PAS domain-containing protein